TFHVPESWMDEEPPPHPITTAAQTRLHPRCQRCLEDLPMSRFPFAAARSRSATSAPRCRRFSCEGAAVVRRAPAGRRLATATCLMEAVDCRRHRSREYERAQAQQPWPQVFSAVALPAALDGRAECGQP